MFTRCLVEILKNEKKLQQKCNDVNGNPDKQWHHRLEDILQLHDRDKSDNFKLEEILKCSSIQHKYYKGVLRHSDITSGLDNAY